jgi:hypothetical protein
VSELPGVIAKKKHGGRVPGMINEPCHYRNDKKILKKQQPPRHTGIVVSGIADNERVHMDNREKGSSVNHPVNTHRNRAIATEENNQAGVIDYQADAGNEKMKRSARPL